MKKTVKTVPLPARSAVWCSAHFAAAV